MSLTAVRAHETQWPGDRCISGGKRQSPIDIRTNGVIKDYNMDFIKYGNLRSDLSVAEALKKRDGLAIISVFCNVQAELVKDQVDATEELMYYIPDLLNIGDRVSGVIMDM
ncbi:Carbonic anhydrase, partial [Operophtera brumata]